MLKLLSLLTAAATIQAHPTRLEKRADIAHDAVTGFAETVPDTAAGELMLKYKPYLHIDDGCVPFPAVQENGDTSAGLAATGDPSGMCDASPGQIYARAEHYNGSFAIMYSWFFPKDQPTFVEGAVGIGHRYDWESAVVWLSGEASDAALQGVAASYHGDYRTSTSPSVSGEGPLIRYYSAYEVLDHSLGFTDTVGGQQPLIAWESLPAVAQEALAGKDWGDASVPFIDANYETKLGEATL